MQQIENLRYPIPKAKTDGLRIQTFGYFEVYEKGTPVAFSRTKTKELFAYLISRRGAECTNTEIISALWENKPNTRSMQSNLRNLVSDLKQTLEDIGESKVLIKRRGRLAITVDYVSCDYYDFLQGDVAAINSYAGMFMQQYGWAEFINGELVRKK